MTCFVPLQPKGEKKVRYHARSVVTGKMTPRDVIRTIAQRSVFKEGGVTGVLIPLEEAPFYFLVPGNYGVSRN